MTEYDLTPAGRGGKLERIEKAEWNAPIRRYLAQNQYVKVGPGAQKGGSESRYLIREPPLKDIKPFLSQLGDDIVGKLKKKNGR